MVVFELTARWVASTRQDFVGIGNDMVADATIRKSGRHDTLVDFGGGDTILFKGVKPGQIDKFDDMLDF